MFSVVLLAAVTWTFDDDVWRKSEPGTPHPRKRMEAVDCYVGVRGTHNIAEHSDDDVKRGRAKKLLALPGDKPKTAKLSHDDGMWFRERFIQKDDECRALRKAIELFGLELAQGGLMGQLVQKELFLRIAKIPKR